MATVVLIHGIWMNGWDMSLLRYRLRDAGFNAIQFSYRSVADTLQTNAQQLQELLNSINDNPVHMVAHSLGGLLVRQLFSDFPQQKSGRIVTLGTPHQGSYVARRLQNSRAGKKILGKSLQQGLLGDAPPWKMPRELGVIAGNGGVGVGRLLTKLPKPNDGTVVVDETPLPGMTDYLILPLNHTGLLFSRAAADQVIHFLNHGKFLKTDKVVHSDR